MNALALNPRRLGLLMRSDLSSARTPAIMLASASGLVFVLYFLTSIGGGGVLFHQIAYPITLVVLGYILSSFTFTEIHETRTGAFALTSPGSVLEKYVAKVLLTSVGWTIALTVAYMATTALGAGVSQLLLHNSHGIFLPAQKWVWQVIAAYLVSQSIFVLGSVYFKKSAFLKTILALTIIAIGFGIFFVISFRVVYWNAFARFWPSETEMNALFGNVSGPKIDRLVDVAGVVGDIFRWAVLPIFMWVTGYVRLRETEV